MIRYMDRCSIGNSMGKHYHGGRYNKIQVCVHKQFTKHYDDYYIGMWYETTCDI